MRQLVSAFILALLLAAVPAYALDVPALKGHVNDYAGMISPENAAFLESALKSFEETDSTQVVILTVPSLEGEALEDYCIKVADAWKIGESKKDNGVIFFAAKNDRRMRIEVGRGLEGVLTDLISGRIVDMVVSPRFKNGDFDGGFAEGTKAIIAVCRGEFKNDGTDAKKDGRPLQTYIIILFIVLYFAVLIISRFSKIAGGVVGALGIPLIFHFGIFALGISGLIAAVVIGFLAGLILPFMPVGGGGGGGRYHGGGSSFGGGFSGGGGGFGGGGASGGW
ncbi:MAG: TPM domain-containing protein [Spirochaetota bacterium]